MVATDPDRPVVALVLAGGVGSRLYPASRSHRPKQFLALDGEASLLARTVERAAFADRVVVVTRPAFVEDVEREAPDAEVLVEPDGKDTGPALCYATARVAADADGGPAPVVCALPSDHSVGDDDAFARTVATGCRVAAATGRLVTFGVEPTRPATGYGYVEPGTDRGEYFEVESFHEKPDAATAADYVERGLLWNAGVFAWTPAGLFDAARGGPLAPLARAATARDDDPGLEAAFDAVEPVSIDRAVFERAEDVAVVPAAFEWDDLGTWDALAGHLPTDDGGNAVEGETLAIDAGDNVLVGEGAHVSVVGVSGLAVVAWGDRVLVVPKAEAQRVREVVDRLRAEGEF